MLGHKAPKNKNGYTTSFSRGYTLNLFFRADVVMILGRFFLGVTSRYSQPIIIRRRILKINPKRMMIPPIGRRDTGNALTRTRLRDVLLPVCCWSADILLLITMEVQLGYTVLRYKFLF